MNLAEPSRVAYLVPSLAPTGPVRVALDLIRNLDHGRYQPLVIPLRAHDPRLVRSVAQDLNATIRPLSAPWWRGRGELLRMLREGGVEILHAHCYKPMILASTLPRGIAKILTIHNWPWLDYPETYGRLKGLAMWRAERAFLSRFDAVVPCSKALATGLAKRRPPESLVPAIQNGVDPTQFAAGRAVLRAMVRREFGIPEDAVMFIVVGKLIARKGVPAVISSYIAAGLKNARLLVVGEGPDMAACAQSAAGRSDVVMTGFRGDIASLLSASDIYVSGAGTEGLPLSVLEAYRCGLRLLLSDIPAHREVLEDCPQTGFLFATPAGLADLMRLEHAHAPWARKGSVQREHFSATQMAARYQHVYDIVLGKNLPDDDAKEEHDESVPGCAQLQ